MVKPPPNASSNNARPYSTPLIFLALQIVFLSALFSYYDVEIPIGPAFTWISERVVYWIPMIKNVLITLENTIRPYFPSKTRPTSPRKQHNYNSDEKSSFEMSNGNLVVFTAAQLAQHDGSNPSKAVHLALLGKVFDVDKGKKHYGKGGAYAFFAGKDATRAFVTGDFSSDGLQADITETDLSESEMLTVWDWLQFYEKEYRMVGTLHGPYYDEKGRPTKLLKKINERMEAAKLWKANQQKEQAKFPPCNSEWKKSAGGRVWCTSKSGGVTREWPNYPDLMN